MKDINYLIEQEYGWSTFADSVNIIQVNGDHDTMVHKPHAEKIAKVLRKLLEKI